MRTLSTVSAVDVVVDCRTSWRAPVKCKLIIIIMEPCESDIRRWKWSYNKSFTSKLLPHSNSNKKLIPALPNLIAKLHLGHTQSFKLSANSYIMLCPVSSKQS